MGSYVLNIRDVDKTKHRLVGGKGANLGELSKIDGIDVPEGFCITTEAYERIIGGTPLIKELLDQLSLLKFEENEKIRSLSGEIRRSIDAIAIPEEINAEITRFLTIFGEKSAYAVRSSATAEDLPTASFAGQQDTYLNLIGVDAILKHISKCWASLFTERAVMYRIQNGFDHREVYLSVVVQKMVLPQAAGILFTADPVTSNRKILSVDASYGLGEALVSGLVNADNYKVRNGLIIDKKIAAKKLAIYALHEGGTIDKPIEQDQQNQQTLTDEQILNLTQMGRKIEEHFGCPQDIEWCLENNTFFIVQSRPITTLYPIPVAIDEEKHVYVSVGHQQMMTDPMKPLGYSIWQLVAAGPMHEAGGRLFIDVTPILISPDSRDNLLNSMGQHDPLIKDALMTVIERGDLIKLLSKDRNEQNPFISNKSMSSVDILAQAGNDTEIVTKLIQDSQASLEELRKNMQRKSGSDLFEFILEDINQFKKSLFSPQSMSVIMAAMNASAWINENLKEWLGEKNAADTLTLSVPNNVTSKMGLELLDVADVIRPYPEVIHFLQHVKEDNFLDELDAFSGGQETRDAMMSYLNKYGMRCAGEIDITRPRWSEKPTMLLPQIISNIKNFETNVGKLKFEQGQQEALKKEQELLERLKQLPNGEQKVEETKQMIDLIRNYTGYREYPKYSIVSRTFIYKQALQKEAEQLVKAGVIQDREDIYYLSYKEFHDAVRSNKVNYDIINKRKSEFKLYEKLTPPRVITSDGEIITGVYRRENIVAGALVGLPVSSGVIVGRARVILNMEEAVLENGDILVTTFTDPSWTPLFLSIKGLVTEVGGLMTHGAVIAREYGIPAVVGVEMAVKRIKDKQMIRVNGTEGYIEIL